jgi:hypothetical protein
MAQVKDVNYFLHKYQGLIVSYPKLEVNILQKFNVNNPEVEIRLDNLTNNYLLTPYIYHEYDYPDKVKKALDELKSVAGGKRPKRRQSKRPKRRQSKSRRHRHTRSRRY